MRPASSQHTSGEWPPLDHHDDLLRASLRQGGFFIAISDQELRYRLVFNPPPGIEATAFVNCTAGEVFGAAGAALHALTQQVLERGLALDAELDLPFGSNAVRMALQIVPQGNPPSGVLCLGRVITPPQTAAALPEASAQAATTADPEPIALASLHHDLLDLIDQVVIVTTAQGELIYANQAAKAMYGIHTDRPPLEPIGGEQWGVDGDVLARLRAELAQGRAWHGHVISRTIDGRRMDVMLTCRPILGPHNNVRAIVTTAFDIGRLKEAEAELRQVNNLLAELNRELRHSRDLLHTLFNGIDDALCLLDHHGRVLAFNQRAADLLDLPSRLFSFGQHPPAESGADDSYHLTRFISQSLVELRPRHARIRRTIGEKPQIIDIQALPQLDDNNGLLQVVLHAQDVTEQVLIEAQMIEQERFVANGRLAATLAHEINTPLQAIENCLHLIGRVSDDRRERYLSLARDEIRRIGEIVQRLLNHYQPSGADAVAVNLNSLIERVLMLTGASLSRQHIRVERTLQAALPPILGRTDELTQVLLNLVMNAAHAMPRGGILHLETRLTPHDPPMVMMAVSDNGVGISPEHQARIFEPYFTTRSSGNGLGLAVCQRIIAAHGGQIRVESAPGSGSRFMISLPKLDA